MGFINEIMSDLIRDEGLRLKPYRDSVGKITIGIGRNLEDKGITKEEAIFMLKNDILECYRDLKTIFTNFDSFTNGRKRALINMRFNLGYRGFRSFKKMISAIKQNNWEKAIEEAKDSKWYRQVPNRANRIIKLLGGR